MVQKGVITYVPWLTEGLLRWMRSFDGRQTRSLELIDTISDLQRPAAMTSTGMTLAIVDDDEDVRRALARLLRSLGHDVRVFGSAEEFEAEDRGRRLPHPRCAPARSQRPRTARTAPQPVDADSRRPHHRRQRSEGSRHPPAIDTPSVTKPFDDVTLMAAIAHAISSADALRERHAH